MAINDRDFPPLPRRKIERRLKTRGEATLTGVTGGLYKSAGSTTTLTSLPDELLLAILEYLPGIELRDFQLPTLVNLSLTDHRLRQIVIEKIYATYDSHFCEPYLFLRTLISNPQLAMLVKHVDITYGSWAHRDRARFMATARDKKIVKEGMRVLSLPGWKDWAAECNDFEAEIETVHTAVLMHTPNITSLIVHDAWVPDHGGPKWIDLLKKVTLGTKLGSVHNFQHLRSVRVDMSHRFLKQLAPLFRLQTLRRLDLREVLDYNSGASQSGTELQRLIPRASNNIEDLHLELYFLQMEVLDVLLASPRRLKSFKYHTAFDDVLQGVDVIEAVGTLRLSTVLRRHKNSLESLHIACDTRFEPQICRVLKLYDVLPDLTSLESLSAPLYSLVDADLEALATATELLPKSILSLRIDVQKHEPMKRLTDILEQLALHHRADDFKLQKLQVNLPLRFGWSRSTENRYRDIFSATNIEFLVVQEQEATWDDDSSDSSCSSDEVNLYSDTE